MKKQSRRSIATKPEKQEAKPQEEQRHNDDKAAKQDEHQQGQQNKDAEKANKDQQKDQEKAAKDQQKQNEKQQKDQQKQAEQQQKNAQHDQQKDNDQRRENQPAVNAQQRPENQRPADQRNDQQRNDQQGSRRAPEAQRANVADQRNTWQQHRASNWKSQHRDWQQRGGYHGYRIPDDRFRADFGEGHHFHLASFPVVVEEGSPRFQINGFWFALVDPWPEFWAADWYETDDCYIDYYDGGYYLEDVRYPGVRLAINVFVG